jgi:alkylhydroperoxidase family enzyme
VVRAALGAGGSDPVAGSVFSIGAFANGAAAKRNYLSRLRRCSAPRCGSAHIGRRIDSRGKPTRTEVNSMTDTFLPYIEKPERLIMKLVYFFYAPTIRQGAYTAEGSCRAIADRLRNVLRKSEPTGQKAHPAIGVGDAHPASGARINICLFCIDIARSFTIKASMNQAKFDALDEYGTSPVYNDAERAALDYVTELTKDEKGTPETFTRIVAALLRARDLRDRLARCQRASLQHD